MHRMNYIIGIDEAGRGPLAGPVSIAAVRVKHDFDKKFFEGIKDSKKLSEEERELWYEMALEENKKGNLDFSVSLIKETVIDRKGIVYAVHLGIRRCLQKIEARAEDSQVFLDGGIKAPKQYAHQLTVIKGDEKIPVVSLASIIAKVSRDRLMTRMAKKFPEFGFESHKGYGTRAHKKLLLELGPTIIHRKSFLKNLPHFQA